MNAKRCLDVLLTVLVIVGVLVALLAPSHPANAQQVLEIDFENERTIIDHEFRSLGSHLVAVDWDRGIFYADDDEEPHGIMLFSLGNGEWLRTISTPEGEGPYEFPHGRAGMALGPNGGLYVAGYQRVIEYDLDGAPVNGWNPNGPLSRRVCNLGGVPAVPTQGGVIRRGPGGTSELTGPVARTGLKGRGDTGSKINTSRIACRDGLAYVALSYDEGPDTVFVYHANGEEGRVPVPLEGAVPGGGCLLGAMPGDEGARACPHWSRGAQPSFDNFGNLVLLGNDVMTHGAIIDPETGCHALIQSTTFMSHTPVAVRGDSVLVYHNRAIERIRDAKPVTVMGLGTSPKVSMNPLRRVSGDPCPGMLPSVREGNSN